MMGPSYYTFNLVHILKTTHFYAIIFVWTSEKIYEIQRHVSEVNAIDVTLTLNNWPWVKYMPYFIITNSVSSLVSILRWNTMFECTVCPRKYTYIWHMDSEQKKPWGNCRLLPDYMYKLLITLIDIKPQHGLHFVPLWFALSRIHSTLSWIHSALFWVHSLLSWVHSTLLWVQSTLSWVHSALPWVHSTLSWVHSTF